MGIDQDGYYSLREILGYGAKYNIVLSERGRGKSWGTKHFLMRQPGQFMCLYRQQPDMSLAVKDWIAPLVMSGAIGSDRMCLTGSDKDGWMLLLDGEIKGYFRCLTQVNHIKQEVFPDTLDWVWLDEFIPLVYKKLPGMASEGDAIRTIVKTIEHDTVHTREEKGLRPVRVLMFANPFNWDNPILSYFKINGLLGPGIHRAGPGVVWEMLDVLPSKEGGKMTVDEFLGEEVHKNMGFMDQGTFVASVPKGAVPYLSMRIGRAYFLIYQHGGKYWIKKAKQHRDIMSQYGGKVLMKFGSLDGLQESEQCLEGSSQLDRFKQMAYRGRLWFDDINVKFDFLNAIYSL